LIARATALPNESGSIFIEALIGSVIVAFALLAMLQSVSSSARSDRHVEDSRLAILVAQSQLASVGSAVPLTAGTSTGSDDRFAWTITVVPANAGDTSQVRVFDVRVAVARAGKIIASLHSIKAGP
jgi:hypothetical protein